MEIGKRVLLAVMAASAVSPAGASLLLYEGFEYTAGNSLHGLVLNGAHQWENYGDNGANVVANAGLSFADAGYVGYETSGLAGIVSSANITAGSVSYASLNVPNFYAPNPSEPPTTFYYSFLVKPGNGETSFEANGTRPNAPYGAYVAGIGPDGSDEWTLTAYNQPTGTFPEVSSGVPFALGETSFVVMRWQIAANWNITVDVAFNPAFGAEPTTWDATLNFERSITFSVWRLAASGSSNSAVYDEMRVATTWEDALPGAVPEPSMVTLLLGGVVLLGRRSRRTRSV